MPNPTAIGRSNRDGKAPYTAIYLDVCEGVTQQTIFPTFGGGVSIAACEALAILATGLPLPRCAALSPQEVFELLDGVPEERQFCSDLAIEALRNAVRMCAVMSANAKD